MDTHMVTHVAEGLQACTPRSITRTCSATLRATHTAASRGTYAAARSTPSTGKTALRATVTPTTSERWQGRCTETRPRTAGYPPERRRTETHTDTQMRTRTTTHTTGLSPDTTTTTTSGSLADSDTECVAFARVCVCVRRSVAVLVTFWLQIKVLQVVCNQKIKDWGKPKDLN